MKRGIMVGVAGLAAVVAACAGCSSNKSSTGASSRSAAPPAAAGPQVTVDGQNQNVSGQVTCNTANGVTTIGIGDASAGVGAVLSTDNPPIVHSVGLGYVNGIGLGFSDAVPPLY